MDLRTGYSGSLSVKQPRASQDVGEGTCVLTSEVVVVVVGRSVVDVKPGGGPRSLVDTQ